MTLLKNEGARLPLSGGSAGPRRLAVIGPNANATATMQGNYQGVAPFLTSPLAGLAEAFPGASVAYAAGCAVNSSDASGIGPAAALAAEAEAVVLVVGLDQTVESEGLDRYALPLPGQQA